MISEIIAFLSGNVPGGIALYLFVVGIVFVALFSISRRNDLFTSKQSKRWFAVLFVVITVAYIFLWRKSPPPTVYERYTVLAYAEEPNNQWLASFFEQSVRDMLAPNRSTSNYYFPQSWFGHARIDCQQSVGQCKELSTLLDIENVILLKIEGTGAQRALKVYWTEDGDEENLGELTFRPRAPQSVVKDLRGMVSLRFPLRAEKLAVPETDSLYVVGRSYYERALYAEAEAALGTLLARRPNYVAAQKYYQYSKIKLAELEKSKAAAPVLGEEKPEWKHMLEDSRQVLIPLVQQYYRQGVEDALLSIMIAESFMLEEQYGDAEKFLKIAHGENPYSIEALYNLSFLHESRYADLYFTTEEELLRHILTLCPIHERALVRYIERLLLRAPVDPRASAEIVKQLDHYLDIQPLAEQPLVLLGNFYETVSRYAEAAQTYARVDSLYPGRGYLQYNMGIVAFKQADFAAAEQHFRHAIEVDDFLDAHLYLGAILKEAGKCEEALESFRYRVRNKLDEDDYYALQAMKGIRECLELINGPAPEMKQSNEASTP